MRAGVLHMQFVDNAVSKIRHAFNAVASSDTAQGAALLGSLAFTASGGNLAFAAASAAIGGLAGAENLRTLFNQVVNPGQQPVLVPIPVRVKNNHYTGPKQGG